MSFPYYVQLCDGEELETHSSKLHAFGTRGITEDGRVYRYCKATANTIARPYWGAQSRCYYAEGTADDCYEGDSSAAVTVGDMTVTIADTNSDHVADWYADGYAVLFYAVNTRMVHILSSTAAGTTSTLSLAGGGIPETKTSAVFMTVHPSPYSQVERVHGGGSAQAATVCVPNTTVAASQYFWGQTWGPCYCTPQASALGNASYARLVTFNYDGSINIIAAHSATSAHQIAGYLLPEHGAGDQFFMLTLAP
jgi:hypothetical protein